MEAGILKLTIKTGQNNFRIVFIFVSFEGKSYYRVVSGGQSGYDCRLYCGRSQRMQSSNKYSEENYSCSILVLVG